MLSIQADRVARARRGFTLVEMLVVVAVVVVLIALLLPSLKRAKYVTSETMCMGNLREVAVGLTSYASDNIGWFPKNGAYRNSFTSLTNKQYWNIKAPLSDYIGGQFHIMVCPLTEENVTNPDNPSSSTYNLLFNAYGAPVPRGPVGCDASDRFTQYDINGNLIADDTTNHGVLTSAMRTWYWPYLKESDILRRVNDSWKVTGQDQRFRLLAMDRIKGRGHPVRSRQVNHPEPTEIWWKDGDQWRGESQWMPRTSANYAGTDGSVIRQQYSGHIYYHESPPEAVVSNGVGLIPEQFLVK